jgi:hypothetical protein
MIPSILISTVVRCIRHIDLPVADIYLLVAHIYLPVAHRYLPVAHIYVPVAHIYLLFAYRDVPVAQKPHDLKQLLLAHPL